MKEKNQLMLLLYYNQNHFDLIYDKNDIVEGVKLINNINKHGDVEIFNKEDIKNEGIKYHKDEISEPKN
jgi:hypothetical protein